MMDSFITKDGKRLRRGYTTGSCAAAAAKAAALLLLGGEPLERVYLLTPAGIGLTLPLADVLTEDNVVRCGIVKDSGDDPDITDGITIYAKVEKIPQRGAVQIDGGEGIGRVTKPGLDQPVGAAAINSTPRRMIETALREIMEDFSYAGGLAVTISAPEGAKIAEKTFNPRLGIAGGISILGTTGIVEPMSDSAVVETIKAELSMRRAAGQRFVLLTPGNYGADYIKNTLNIAPETAVTTSNFIGEAFSAASEMGFEGALLVGHIGKLVKLAGGMFNTHSRYGDCRAEIFASHAALCEADTETVHAIMDSAMTDDMLALCRSAGILSPVLESILGRISVQLASFSSRYFGGIKTGALLFSREYGTLGQTEAVGELLEAIRRENAKKGSIPS